MAKLELRGWFHEIGEAANVGKTKDFFVQRCVFIVPGYKDQMREIDNPDEPWLLEISGKKIDELKITAEEHTEMKAKITVIISGFATEKTATKDAFMGYKVKLIGFEPFNPRA